jgi:predicted nucleic acid-binding protein
VIVADTSAWIEYDRATGSAVDRRLSELIATDGPVAVTEPVIMEVLAGAHSDARQADLRRLLLRFHLYRFDVAADFEGAARIYRRCRQAGIMPRGLVDCMIAAVARRHQATLLTCDAGLSRAARVIGIELDQPAQSDPPQPA